MPENRRNHRNRNQRRAAGPFQDHDPANSQYYRQDFWGGQGAPRHIPMYEDYLGDYHMNSARRGNGFGPTWGEQYGRSNGRFDSERVGYVEGDEIFSRRHSTGF